MNRVELLKEGRERFRQEMGEGFFNKLRTGIDLKMAEVEKSEERRKQFLARAHNKNRNIVYHGSVRGG